MKAEIISIGNSRGIRIPQSILEQCGFNGAVDLEAEAGKLIIRPAKTVREGWDKSFEKRMESDNDDSFLEEEIVCEWDDQEWEW